ncbi:MAG TPA: NUDIX domain-containing protein [Verrucomicrobiae bacterium]|nr:NUDIX domain-containing protein [Verrucomicrobiae bacterium]
MRKVVPKDAVLVPDQAERVFHGVIYDVYHWQQKLFDDSDTTFEMIKRVDTIVVIGVTGDKILVIDEEQPHAGSGVSFPGGRVDPDDASILEASQREMQEETGYEFSQWRLIDVRQPFVKIEWFIHVYMATDVRKRSTPQQDGGEKITIRQESFESLKKLIDDKVGSMGEARDLFDNLKSLDDLLALPEFQGQEVDR